jgi:NAD-dependent dihydropyrimidine dehydrogenase PreA subunit
MLALVPLRGIAAVTVGLCAAGKQENLFQALATHDHGSHQHQQAPGSDPDPKVDCNACAEHCSSAAVVVPAVALAPSSAAGSDRVALPQCFAAGHVPEHLDPPPLAL